MVNIKPSKKSRYSTSKGQFMKTSFIDVLVPANLFLLNIECFHNGIFNRRIRLLLRYSAPFNRNRFKDKLSCHCTSPKIWNRCPSSVLFFRGRRKLCHSNLMPCPCVIFNRSIIQRLKDRSAQPPIGIINHHLVRQIIAPLPQHQIERSDANSRHETWHQRAVHSFGH